MVYIVIKIIFFRCFKDVSNEIPEPKKESAKSKDDHQHEQMQADLPAKPDAKSMLTVGKIVFQKM